MTLTGLQLETTSYNHVQALVHVEIKLLDSTPCHRTCNLKPAQALSAQATSRVMGLGVESASVEAQLSMDPHGSEHVLLTLLPPAQSQGRFGPCPGQQNVCCNDFHRVTDWVSDGT